MSPPLRIWTADRLLVCVPADLHDPLVAGLRHLLARTPAIDAVLELLAAEGLAATPSFVCAATEGEGARVVIRGDLEAVAHGRDGSSLTLSAGRSATWNDDVVADIASISIDLGPDAGRFEWLATAGAVPPAAAAPAPVETPAPAPPVAPEPKATTRDEVPEPATVAEPAPSAAPTPQGEPKSGPESEHDDPHTLDEHAFLLLRDDQPAPSGDAPPAPVAVPAAAPPPPPIPGGLDFSQLLDDTSHRPPPPPVAPLPPPPAALLPAVGEPTAEVPAWSAAPPPPPSSPTLPPPPESSGTGTGLGEHDGRTITLADLRRLQGVDGPPAPLAPNPAEATTTRARHVRAVQCPAGHPNPPTVVTCRRCGTEVTDRTVVTVPRPVIARLVFESGLVVDVDRPQLIGRRPMAPADADDLPNLVTIPSPDGDISRGHTAVRLEGWDLLVEDVGSTNGTEVRLPGAEPVRLREHDPVLAVVGTQVTLAGTVRFTIQAPEH